MRVLKGSAIKLLSKKLRWSLVLIADDHGKSEARCVVADMLRNCDVKTLLLEVPSDSRAGSGCIASRVGMFYGSSLAQAALGMRGMKEEAAANLLGDNGYFSTPDPYQNGFTQVGLDAEPNLRDLAGIAISKSIPVVPCDTNYRAVVNMLNTSARGEPLPNNALFADQGINFRDQLTARNVAKYRKESSIYTGLLMLWGVNHMKGNAYRIGLVQRLSELQIPVNLIMDPVRYLA